MVKRFIFGCAVVLASFVPMFGQVTIPSQQKLSQQGVAPQDILAVFPSMTVTGSTTAFSLVGDPGLPGYVNSVGFAYVYAPKFGTVQAFVSGTPTTCTYHVYGTLKLPQANPVFPADYQDLTGALDCTTAAGSMASIAYKPVAGIVIQLSALTGGTSPSVTFRYLGAH